MIAAAGIAVERIDVVYELDMHYLGQTHTVAVPLPVSGPGDRLGVTEEHDPRRVRGRLSRPRSAGCCRALRRGSCRCGSPRSAAGRHSTSRCSRPALRPSLDKAALGSRPVWFDGGWRDTRVWSRLDLPAGAVIEAPAVLEQPDATIVIEPGLAGRIDPLGNLIVEPAS